MEGNDGFFRSGIGVGMVVHRIGGQSGAYDLYLVGLTFIYTTISPFSLQEMVSR